MSHCADARMQDNVIVGSFVASLLFNIIFIISCAASSKPKKRQHKDHEQLVVGQSLLVDNNARTHETVIVERDVDDNMYGGGKSVE